MVAMLPSPPGGVNAGFSGQQDRTEDKMKKANPPTRKKGKPAPNKGKKYPPERLTREQMDALYGTFTGAPSSIRNRAIVYVLHRCGLRLTECLYLRVGDVNLTTREGFNPRPKGRPRSKYELAQNAAMKRTPRMFGIPQDCSDALGNWLRVRHDLGINGESPLFCTLRGRPVNSNYPRIFLPRLGKRAEVKTKSGRVHPHMLRHTFACEMYEEGHSLPTICAALGHESIKYTLDYLKALGMMPENFVEAMKRR
jgi:site-specific recombinase XerD